jgi:YegS/Rv2252/BmrU family lipid kinase
VSKYYFIVNPAAGRGAGKRAIARVERLLEGSTLHRELVVTERQGHATVLAKQADADVIVSVGGDGTNNEIANALVGSSKAMGILPTGSGNDLIKSLGIPVDLQRAFNVLLHGRRRTIDVATVACYPIGSSLNAAAEGCRYFVNGIGVGLDAAVAERTTHIQHLSGTLLYFVALLQALRRFKPPVIGIKHDGDFTSSRRFLVAVGNGRCAGGGFYLTPDAELDDGLLDVCVVDNVPLRNIIKLIPKVMTANHRNSNGISMFTSKIISIHSDQPLFVHADGEIVGRDVTRVEVAVQPGSLDVLVPA